MTLKEQIAQKSIEDLRRHYQFLIEDQCDYDSRIRKAVETILGKEYIDGNSYYVPSNVDIVEKLVEIITRNG